MQGTTIQQISVSAGYPPKAHGASAGAYTRPDLANTPAGPPIAPRPNDRHRAANTHPYPNCCRGCAVMIFRPTYAAPCLFNHWPIPQAPGPVASAGASTQIAQCNRRACTAFSPHVNFWFCVFSCALKSGISVTCAPHALSRPRYGLHHTSAM